MSRNDQYPYIQNEIQKEDTKCEVCKLTKTVRHIEWRVDWFQGNCEFEDICDSCFDKRRNDERKKQEKYNKKMAPIWDRQRKNQENRVAVMKQIISDSGLTLKEYENGQWSIGDKIDWWTTTGTVIERESRKRHHISFKSPDKLKTVLANLR